MSRASNRASIGASIGALRIIGVLGLLIGCLDVPVELSERLSERVGNPIVPELASQAQWRAAHGRSVRLGGALTLVELLSWPWETELLLAWRGRWVAGEDSQDRLVRVQWPEAKGEASGKTVVLPRLGSTVEALQGKVVELPSGLGLRVKGAPSWRRAVRPAPPASNEEQLLIAAFNVQNYFLTLGERGATTAAEQEQQVQRLAATLAALPADIWALVELEHGGGALESLRLATNALLGEETYQAIVLDSCAGTGAIEAGLLYRSEAVALAGEPSWILDPALRRCPLLQTFEVGGQLMTLGVVHWKSRRCAAGSTRNQRPGDACGGEERLGEARALTRWMKEYRVQQPGAEVLWLGDFNSHRHDAALQHLRTAGLLELLRQPVAKPVVPLYSYVYRGEVSLLDGLWATAGLQTRQVAAGIWHSNADEPRRQEPTLSEGVITLQVPGPWRSSDHDPVWAAFRL